MNKYLKYFLVALLGSLSIAATVKISDMVVATTIGNADVYPIVQSGVNKQVKQATLLTNIFANVTAGSGVTVTNQGTNIIVAATVTGIAAGSNVTTSTNNGVVTVNASAGKVVNYSLTQTTNTDSTALTIPVDNTIPQSGEGKEYTTFNYTAATTGNILLIKVTGTASHSALTATTFALFFDSETDARAATDFSAAAGYQTPFTLCYKYTAANTSSHTWRVRFGPVSGTAYINRNSSGDIFGGTSFVTIEIWELSP